MSISDFKSSVEEDVSTEKTSPVADVDDDYPHGARLAIIVLSLMLGMFLVALDNVSLASGGQYILH